jgi:hypothetical protein
VAVLEDEHIAGALGATVEEVAESVCRCTHLLAAPSRAGLALRVIREALTTAGSAGRYGPGRG